MVCSNSRGYRAYIDRELGIRMARNPAYSLRAMARDLGMAAPKLSQVLSGTCGLSRESALRIGRKLKLEDHELDHFVALVESKHARSKHARETATAKVQALQSEGFGELELERFEILSEWHYYAILELTEVQGFDSDPHWIARRLGIARSQVTHAIEVLQDHGLLECAANGELRQTHRDLATPGGVSSRAIRAYHSQIGIKAQEALEGVPVQERDFSAITLAIPSNRIEEARQKLREFRRAFSQSLQETPEKDRVYCLAIQFFPMDQIGKESEV